MNNQEQNREALIEHIAEQDRIIRRRNQQIERQAQNAMESQWAIEEQNARNSALAADLAAAVVRADKAEKERDWMRDGWNTTSNELAELRATLTPDAITDEMIERGAWQYVKEGYVSWRQTPETVKNNARESVHGILRAALTEPPARPEGAEDIEAILHNELPPARLDEDEIMNLANYLATHLTDPTSKEA